MITSQHVCRPWLNDKHTQEVDGQMSRQEDFSVWMGLDSGHSL